MRMEIMETAALKNRENTTLDVFKALACVIVTTAHLPSLFTTEVGRVYFNEWFLRFCVPFFFVCSGYFFSKASDKKKPLKRMAWLLALCYVLYLPAVLEGASDARGVLSRLRWNLVFGYEHLWYLNASLEGMLIWYLLEKIPVISKAFRKLAVPAGVVLLPVGALLDEHYRLINNEALRAVGELLSVFGGPRNAIFMGFPLLVLGGAMAQHEDKIRKVPAWALVALWVFLRGLAYWECGYLYQNLGMTISCDLTFFGCWPALCLFALSGKFQLPIPVRLAKCLRRMTEYVYILHPLIAALILKYIPLAPVPLWLGTIALCGGIYLLLEKQFAIKQA